MRKPWESEPDHLRWTSKAGLDCVVNRGELQHLCGYVLVPDDHVFWGVGYASDYSGDEDVLGVEARVSVHGGLTFSNNFAPGEDIAPGEWWFGFDCAHSGDWVPGYEKLFSRPYTGIYRDIEYVKKQCESLASQLVDVMKQR